jgi:hypothetical protein
MKEGPRSWMTLWISLLDNFFIAKSFKSELKIIREIGHTLSIVGKHSLISILVKVIWKFSDLRCWRLKILSNFCDWKFNKIEKRF